MNVTNPAPAPSYVTVPDAPTYVVNFVEGMGVAWEADPIRIERAGDRWRVTWDDGTKRGFVVEFTIAPVGREAIEP